MRGQVIDRQSSAGLLDYGKQTIHLTTSCLSINTTHTLAFKLQYILPPRPLSSTQQT